MKSIHLIAFLFITLLINACQSEKIYELHVVPGNELEWHQQDTMEHHVDIADTSAAYDIVIALRYAEQFPFPKLRVEMVHTSPSGRQSYQMFEIIVQDESGNYQGESYGEVIQLKQVITPARRFREKGIHTFRLSHDMPDDPVPLILKVGLVLEVSDAEAYR